MSGIIKLKFRCSVCRNTLSKIRDFKDNDNQNCTNKNCRRYGKPMKNITDEKGAIDNINAVV